MGSGGTISGLDGTAQGRAIRWSKIQIRLYETEGLNVQGQELLFRSAADNMGSAVPVFTGIFSTSTMGYSADAPITIIQNYPLPVTVLGIYGVLEIGEM